ncbi:MAG: hypothetical protein AB9880_03025 [Christensenellales bacterium]
MQDHLLVLNFDSRAASAVAMRLRLERIDCRIVPADTSLETILAEAPRGLVLAGDTAGEAPLLAEGRLLAAGLPMLALGDASLALCGLLHGGLGEPQPLQAVESVSFLPSPVTEGLAQSERFLTVMRPMLLSEELKPLATAMGQTIGFMHTALPLYGLSFQMEQNDPDGMGILMRFAQQVCGCTPWLTESAFISAAREQIEQTVPEGQAICVLTGGLDSAVAALIASKALGSRLDCLFIDTGLLRENEADDFIYYYTQTQRLNIRRVDAQDRFHMALEGLTRAGDKADAIARVYQQVVNEATAEHSFTALIRGTSANDVLRTGDDYVTPGIQTDRPLIEPLRELFKEEIRNVGEALGLPQDIYQAQPFPGTGLALRVLGEATRSRLAILRKADAIFQDEIRQAGLGRRLWKYFAVLFPLSEGEEGPALAVVLRAVTMGTVSGQVRALPARLPHDLQERCAMRVLQAFPEIIKVVNDITPGGSYSQIERR